MTECYVITHYDLIPPHAEGGLALVARYAELTRAAPGVHRVELLQQLYRKNHLEMVTVYEDLSDYEAHLSNPGTVEFRHELHPMLGAPVDDRLHSAVALE